MAAGWKLAKGKSWRQKLEADHPSHGKIVDTIGGEDKAEGGDGPNRDIASYRLDDEDDLQKAAKRFARYDKKVKEGEERAQELRERFAPWYYVISDESFQRLHRDRTELLKETEKEEKAAE